jgi:hypothetical protein
MKLVRLIKMCLNEISFKVHVVNIRLITFPIQKSLKEGDALLLSLFDFALEYAIRKAQEDQVTLKLNESHQLVFYINDVNLLDDNIDNIKKNIET